MAKYRNKKIEQCCKMLKALSNPHRLKIFLRLVKCCKEGVEGCEGPEEMKTCVGQLGKDLGIVPSTISHHIKELHRAGFIRMERRGQKMACWVDSKTVQTLAKFFTELETD